MLSKKNQTQSVYFSLLCGVCLFHTLYIVKKKKKKKNNVTIIQEIPDCYIFYHIYHFENMTADILKTHT